MSKLFIDIETIPAPEEDFETLREIYERKRESNDQFSLTFDEFVHSTALNGTFGRLFCIAYALDNNPVEVLTGPEKGQLEQFWKLVAQHKPVIGHNILEFDLVFLRQRSIILRVKPEPISLRKYASFPVYDTMSEWNAWTRSTGWSSLDIIARSLGLQSSKTDLDGSKVAKYYKLGKTKEIIDYCKADVELTRKVYNRMIFNETEDLSLF